MTDIDFRTLNLNLLPALQALLSERSVGAAAKHMGVSQSAMSHSLGRLRAQLDDELLVVTGRTMALTPRGREIAQTLPRALDGLRDALAGPPDFDPTTATRRFTIASVDFFELLAVPDLLPLLHERAPGIDVQIERLGPDSAARLASGQLDLVFAGSSPGLAGAGLRHQELFRDPFVVIARPDHPEIGTNTGRRLTRARYAALEHVVVSIEGKSKGVVDRVLHRHGLTRRVSLRVPHFVSAPLAVLHSDLICTIARSVGHRARELFGVQVHNPPIPLPEIGMSMWWPRQLADDPAHTWLRERFIDGDIFPATKRA
ncbi:MAG: LysR family transcriptional regulator [Myxococcota bacterium]